MEDPVPSTVNKSGPIPVIFDGRFFKITSQDGIKITADCVFCKQSKPFRGLITSTSNFLKHLKRVHPKEAEEYDATRKDESSSLKRRRMAVQASNVTNAHSTRSIEEFINRESRSSGIEKAVLQFFVKAMIPLSIVDSEEFRSLIHALKPNSSVMSRRTLSRQINDEFRYMQQRISSRLNEQTYICMTLDIWTCKGMSRSFIGVTSHWFNSESLERESSSLACRRFASPHSYDRIYESITTVVNEYKIPWIRITSCCTDNGSNFVKCFEYFQGFSSNAELEEDSTDIVDDNENDTPEDVEFVDASAILEELPESTDPERHTSLPRHQKCASHTFNLVCTKDIQNFRNKTYRSALAKCYGVWNRVSKSSKANKLVRSLCGVLFVKPCPTRWNSLYDSIVHLLEQKSNLKNVTDGLQIPAFKEQEITCLQEYVLCVKPVAKALDSLQGEKHCYFGVLLPTLISVEKKLAGLLETDLQFCGNLVELLLAGIRKRFGDFLNFSPSKEDAIIAAVTHPYFKLRWINAEEKKKMGMEIFIKAVTSMNLSEVQKNQILPVPVQAVDNSEDFFEFSTDPVPQLDLSTAQMKIKIECENYIQNVRDDLQLLHEYPSVKKTFLKYNTALPSSAPVERLFNFSGMILSPKRRSISDGLFEKLTLMKVNKL